MTDPAGFLRDFARDRAERVVERPYGFVVRSMRRFPRSHDHNATAVLGPVEPARLLADVEAEFGDVDYRDVEMAAELVTPELTAAVVAAGYARQDNLVMTRTRPPDDDRPPVGEVVTLTLDERIAFAERAWATEFGEPDPAVRHELAARAGSAVTAADCTFLAVVGPDGVEASADLFVRGDTAQVEEVVTVTPARGRGHASRLVRAAAELAVSEHPDRMVFLLADADDWPRHLYARLGFEVTGRRTVWSRSVSDR